MFLLHGAYCKGMGWWRLHVQCRVTADPIDNTFTHAQRPIAHLIMFGCAMRARSRTSETACNV